MGLIRRSHRDYVSVDRAGLGDSISGKGLRTEPSSDVDRREMRVEVYGMIDTLLTVLELCVGIAIAGFVCWGLAYGVTLIAGLFAFAM